MKTCSSLSMQFFRCGWRLNYCRLGVEHHSNKFKYNNIFFEIRVCWFIPYSMATSEKLNNKDPQL